MPKLELICFVEVEFNYMMLDMLRMLPLCVNRVRTLVVKFRKYYEKCTYWWIMLGIELGHENVN